MTQHEAFVLVLAAMQSEVQKFDPATNLKFGLEASSNPYGKASFRVSVEFINADGKLRRVEGPAFRLYRVMDWEDITHHLRDLTQIVDAELGNLGKLTEIEPRISD